MFEVEDPPILGDAPCPSVTWMGEGGREWFQATFNGHKVEGSSREEALKTLDEQCGGTNFASSYPYL